MDVLHCNTDALLFCFPDRSVTYTVCELLSDYVKKKKKKKSGLSTRYSQPVTHASTNRARRCLTSQIGRDGVCSAWYGPSPPAATLYQQLYARRSRRSRLRASRSRRCCGRGRLPAWLEGGCPPRNKPKKKSSPCAPVSRSSPLRRRTAGLRLSQGNGRQAQGDRSGVRIAAAEPNRGAAGDGRKGAKGRGRGEMGGGGAVGRCGFRPRGQRERCKG